jgi:hypothetical protein
MHCKAAQSTKQADCNATEADGGVVASSYGPTMYNQEGDDDGCKYHLSWVSTPIAENQDVTFTVTATYLATGEPNPPACAGCPMQGLNTNNGIAELDYSDKTHPPPNTNQLVTATSTPGTYTFGPVLFDVGGTWTVRFHFFDLCTEVAPDSPHGHAAFYVHVP